MSWQPIDFGELVPGESGVTATGTGQSDGYRIVKKITVFTTVATGTAAVLPSSYASGTELMIIN